MGIQSIMLLIILILVAVLVGLIVVVLKKDHQRRQIALVEQHQTLPPISLQRAEQAHCDQDEEPVKVCGLAQQSGLNWKERCKNFRNEKQFQEALGAAQEAWPQWQSYEQSAITLRAMIKEYGNSNQEHVEACLLTLYRLAAEASFLYDRPAGQSAPRWQSVAQTIARHDLEQRSFAWQSLGYQELKLLTTTDIKKMILYWGVPDHHLSARSLADTYHP